MLSTAPIIPVEPDTMLKGSESGALRICHNQELALKIGFFSFMRMIEAQGMILLKKSYEIEQNYGMIAEGD